jgi:hypothetical protein
MTGWWAASFDPYCLHHPVRCFGILQRLSRKARNWRAFSFALELVLVSVRRNAAISNLGLRPRNSRSWRGPTRERRGTALT